MRGINERRRKIISARWKEKSEYRTLDFWDGFFKKVKESDFLMGRVPAREGRTRPFVATFDWLIESRNFDKVNEGHYQDRRTKNTYQSAADMDPDEILANFHAEFNS